MYVFGGGDGKYWLNDLLILDLVNREWSGPVQTNGIAPVGRLQHSAITFDKKIYIFGGEPDQFRQLNDIFYLDTSTLTWVKPIVTGEDPSARVSTTGCLIDSKIYYFGGYDGVQWMNDVHVFDIDSNRWSKVQTYGYKPRPRCRHTANIVKGQLYIFGGNDCELSFNDIWALSIGV
jgi:N-acetylneuraminic acid mutarotase